MQTKMACSHLKRYRLSCAESAKRPRNAKTNTSNNKKKRTINSVYSFNERLGQRPLTHRGRALPSYMNVIGFGPGI